MLRRIITLMCALLIAGAYADKSEEKYDKIQKILENIVSKAGISIGGDVKAQYFYSGISGEGVDSSKRQAETNEFTSVDFDIKARPNEAVSARVMFRMHQNWQNFFSDVSNPIFSRWISIDGNPLDMFRFSIGDFKEKYSPLTLYSPEIDILYEPYVFKRQRENAMDELFIGDNYRVLQGVNLGFDAEIVPIFNEFHLGFVAGRLAGANHAKNIEAGSMVVAEYQNTENLSKYFTGTNLDMVFMKGISLAGTWLSVFDHKGSYIETVNRGDTSKVDTVAQLTNVISLRPGVDISKTFGMSEALKFGLSAEVAFSIDDSTWYEAPADTTLAGNFASTKIKGNALNLGAELGYSPSDNFEIVLNGSYISNDKSFKNTLAQSPTFYGQRIMNFESDMSSSNKKGSHYSTFDALYHSVFKFCPATTGDWWDRIPMMKTAYYRGVILDQDNLYKFMENDFDPSVQLTMPLGPATPNRAGLNADISMKVLGGGIEAKGLMSMLSEKEPSDTVLTKPESEFSKFGGGLKIGIDKLAKIFKFPFEISGSVVKSSASNKGIPNDSVNNKWEINSGFTNIGLYYKFWKRAAFLAGYQIINNTATIDGLEVEQTQKHWTLGLEWKVNDGADIVTSIGQIKADVDTANGWLLGKGATVGDFEQLLIDVSLQVKF